MVRVAVLSLLFCKDIVTKIWNQVEKFAGSDKVLSYAKDCIQRLDKMGYDYSKPIITK